MDTFKVAPNKRYVLIAAGLFVLLIPFSIVIITTLLGGNTDSTTNITTNITAHGARQQTNEKTVPSMPPIPLSFHNIIPGQTDTITVTNTLGNPLQTSHTGDFTIYYYAARGTNHYNIIICKNNIVQYIIAQTPNLPSFFTQYKQQTHKKEDGVLYDSNDDGSGVNLYTFAQKGIAFADNPDTNQTNQIHYFIPQNYQTFLLSEGVYLSFLTPPAN